MAEIHERMSRVMAAIGAIGKGQENKFDKYRFRGIDDIYNHIQPALVAHGVTVCPEVLDFSIDEFRTSQDKTQQRAIVKVAHHFYAPDGSSVTVTTMGEGADRGDKAVNKAHSSAYKTAFLQCFCIPTEEIKDSEHESPDLSGGKANPRKTRKASPAKKEDPKSNLSVEQRNALSDMVALRVLELGLDLEHYLAGAGREIVHAAGYQSSAEIPVSDFERVKGMVGEWKPRDAPEFDGKDAA